MPESAETPISRYLSILPQTPEEKILHLLIEVGREIVGADEGSLLVFDESTQELVFAMTVGRNSETTLLGQRVPLGSGLTGLAALTHEVQTGAPTFNDIRQPENVTSTPEQPSAVLAAPMLVNDVLVGVLTAISFEKTKRFSGRDAQLYVSFAAIGGLVVQQRRKLAMFEESSSGLPLQETLSESHQAEQAILATLRRILSRSPESVMQVASLLTAIDRLIGSRPE
jgi:sigma-B regulation protein RsbU (phosphoserine phosphatase)